jgi:RNA polymerase sigma factor (sigma-70 family)
MMQSFTERSAETNATSRGSAQGPGDESLVAAAKRGHSMAFATLSERYRQQLFRSAHRITRNCEDAEDAVQDALMRAFIHVTDFNGRSSFGTWLTRIAINSALMILRKKRASLEIAVDCNDNFGADGPRYEITDHQPNPERHYAQSEEEILLKKAIQSLRPALRVVVQIQQLQECSMRETAETIGISLAAAKGRLFHAKNALRRSMILRLGRQPRFAGGVRALRARQWPTGNMAGLNGESALRGKKPRRGMVQPLLLHGAEFPRDSWRSNKEEGDAYVNETKEKRNYRAPSNLRQGGDRRSLSRDLGA